MCPENNNVIEFNLAYSEKLTITSFILEKVKLLPIQPAINSNNL